MAAAALQEWAIQIKWFGTHAEYDEIDASGTVFKKKKS
jgi:mRNA-degrading endonuclease HigB of HigAB toxin-antitoxin module